jgi:hypothetical protein
LFTFCPPGPDARTAVHRSSAAGMVSVGETTSGPDMRVDCRRKSIEGPIGLAPAARAVSLVSFLQRSSSSAGDEQEPEHRLAPRCTVR